MDVPDVERSDTLDGETRELHQFSDRRNPQISPALVLTSCSDPLR